MNSDEKYLVTTISLKYKHKSYLAQKAISLSRYVQQKIEKDMKKK